MIERYVTIRNFRTIGVMERETLELNYLMDDEGTFGGLVTLIGENNSGKSNYLDAIRMFGDLRLLPSDIPFHVYNDSVTPEIEIVVHDDEEKTKSIIKLHNNKHYYSKNVDGEWVDGTPSLYTDELTNEMIEYILSENFWEYISSNQNSVNVYNAVTPLLQKVSDKTELTVQEVSNINSYLTNSHFVGFLSHTFTNEQILHVVDVIRDGYVRKNEKQNAEIIKQFVNEKYGIDLLPNIVNYVDKDKITTQQTISNVVNGVIQNKVFLDKLFSLLEGTEIEELESCYRDFHGSGRKNKFKLTNFERKVNKPLKELSLLFNKVYSFDDEVRYEFRLDLETDNIYFMIEENGEDIHLDSQSTGFKWFFDFFFNVFANKSIGYGDIVILDEPATNLHVAGQIELRNQIKGFGMSNGVTFVMCTHTPFLINPDFFEEVRIVSKEGTDSKVMNKFSVSENNEIDVMMPIKTALTVSSHIIQNPNDTLVFVEGITDYNYLVAFKNLLGYENISFMPIQGIKRNNLYKELLKINKFPIVLVDSDKAGKEVVDKYKDKQGMEIHQLSDIDESFVEIEDLFTKDDREVLNVDKKYYKVSSGFKNELLYEGLEVSDETAENFKKVLDHLSN